MPKVVFKFDREKDLWNIWKTCNSSSKWFDHKKFVSSILLEICENKEFEDCKEELKEFRNKMHDSELIEIFVKAMQEAWDKVNDEYFKRLEKIMKRPIVFEEVSAYITTVTRCPYEFNLKDPWFMVSFFKDILNALVTSAHELIHIQFHNTYWNQVSKEIGEDKTAHLKEALTVLLNLEFRDLWFVDDRGYSPHQKLRDFISEQWKINSDFDILMEKCVEYLKNDDSLS